MFQDLLEKVKEIGMNFAIYAVIIVLGLAGFAGYNMFQKGKAIIDNPTDQAITFTLDGKEYSLEPKTSKEIGLKDGAHKLSINGEELTFTKGEESKDQSVIDGLFTTAALAIVNPTLSDYVLAYQMYGNGPDSARPDDQPITGKVYFEANVTFNLDQVFPDSYSVARGRSYTVINKLYRMADYITEYADELEAIDEE